MANNQIRGNTQIIDGTVSTTKLTDGAEFIQRDGSVPFTATQEGVYPVSDDDLATKEYVDSKHITYEILTDYDSVNGQYMYTGYAIPSSATSSAVWRISRYDFANDIIEYADGDQLYNNVYDNRESLTYS